MRRWLGRYWAPELGVGDGRRNLDERRYDRGMAEVLDRLRAICMALPEVTTARCMPVANPLLVTITSYSPTGSAVTWKLPSVSVVALSEKSELVDFTRIAADGTGR